MSASSQPSVQCERGHRMVRFVVAFCDVGHEHRQYVCPMRVGSAPCGERLLVPPYAPGCFERDRTP